MLRNSTQTDATIPNLLAVGEADRIAIANQNGIGVTYEQLRRLIRQTHEFLAAQGIRGRDVVALALQNSPQTAALSLALASYCSIAPLNPRYRAPEIEFVLRDVSARVLVTAGDLLEAATAAERCGVELIRMQTTGAAPGMYELDANRAHRGAAVPAHNRADFDTRLDGSLPSPGDIALLLHTSGTTARPKQVALTHRNLYLSTQGVLEVLQLQPEDRSLLVMPLYHVHGFVAGLLASIAAGATVCCPPGFQATSFFSWLESSTATWYTAVPTMHQAILARAPRNKDVLARHRLRFIRSSSSMLYPSVLEDLGAVFGVPVLNAYGMTEAAHQIASTRLPASGAEGSASRTSVGYSSGPLVAVLNSNNKVAAREERGEVVLRGEQIISGYLSPASANEVAFSNGWFRTGDEGFLSADGALTLTGRLKEIINSGGEKISPLEVEEAFLLEPAVADVVAFAVPHPLLGEAVGAAVVLREGYEAISEPTLLDAVRLRLARHKLPRSIFFVNEIPRGATGKLQRIGMAERLKIPAADQARRAKL